MSAAVAHRFHHPMGLGFGETHILSEKNVTGYDLQGMIDLSSLSKEEKGVLKMFAVEEMTPEQVMRVMHASLEELNDIVCRGLVRIGLEDETIH